MVDEEIQQKNKLKEAEEFYQKGLVYPFFRSIFYKSSCN